MGIALNGGSFSCIKLRPEAVRSLLRGVIINNILLIMTEALYPKAASSTIHPFGISGRLSEGHSANALSHIVSSPWGRTIFSSDLHPQKALHSMFLRVSGRRTLRRLSQESKALPQMSVTPSGMTISSSS